MSCPDERGLRGWKAGKRQTGSEEHLNWKCHQMPEIRIDRLMVASTAGLSDLLGIDAASQTPHLALYGDVMHQPRTPMCIVVEL
jgi:hypothetical protein